LLGARKEGARRKDLKDSIPMVREREEGHLLKAGHFLGRLTSLLSKAPTAPSGRDEYIAEETFKEYWKSPHKQGL